MAVICVALVQDIRPAVGHDGPPDLTKYDAFVRYVPCDGLNHGNVYGEFWAINLDGNATGSQVTAQIANATQAEAIRTFGLVFGGGDSVKVLPG